MQKLITEIIAELKDEVTLLKLKLKEQETLVANYADKIPRLQAALSKGNLLIYEMKKAIYSADDQFKHAMTLFDDVSMPAPIPADIYTMVALYKGGKSFSQMAEMLLGNKDKKSSMYRAFTKAKINHPELFDTNF